MQRPRFEWLPDGRTMLLLNTLTYVDPKGVEWIAPEGSLVDGASIPRALWTLSGSPFVGKYRVASIVHDVYCRTRSRPHEHVHNMFHNLMLDTGVDKKQADRMWWAVTTFGPKWDEHGADLKLSEEERAFQESVGEEW